MIVFHVSSTEVTEKSLRPGGKFSRVETAEAVGGRMVGALGWGLFLSVFTFLLSSSAQ